MQPLGQLSGYEKIKSSDWVTKLAYFLALSMVMATGAGSKAVSDNERTSATSQLATSTRTMEPKLPKLLKTPTKA